jgi:hypothetical protein
MATTYVVSPALLILSLVLLVFVVITIVDMARRPGWLWQQAGTNKALWLTLLIASYLIGSLLLEIPLIVVGALYFARIRPRLQEAAANKGASGSPGASWDRGGPQWPVQGGPPWPVQGGPQWPAQGGPQWPAQGSPGPGGPWPTASYPPPAPPGAAPGAEADTPSAPGASPPAYPSAGTPSSPPAYPMEPPPPQPAPPFGWYPDPSGRHEQRYWDGTRWTEHVRDGGQDSTEALPG